MNEELEENKSAGDIRPWVSGTKERKVLLSASRQK